MRRSGLLLALVALACGGGSSSSTSAGTPQQLNALAQNVASAASAYDTQAAGMANAAACATDEVQYDGQVRPDVVQMQAMGPHMDQMMMDSLGDAADADMACAADAMMAELDHHRSMACASAADMAPNMDEAHRHATAMAQWADHEMARTSAMGSMMGGGMGGMPGGGMSTGHCVKNGDGSYSMH
jgi:hypothetical protein